MSISREFCKEQILRLYQLKGYPKVYGENADEGQIKAIKTALKELVDALEVAGSEESAKAAVDWFVHNSRDCPVPADLRRSVNPIAKLQEYAVAPTACQLCGDSGFKRVVKTVNGQRYEFSEPCDHQEKS